MQFSQTNYHRLSRSERLEARVNSELKSRLQKAAQLQGSSLSEFILKSAEKTANQVIREYQILKLSDEESLKFVNTIFNVSKPNQKLQSAYSKYRKEVLSGK